MSASRHQPAIGDNGVPVLIHPSAVNQPLMSALPCRHKSRFSCSMRTSPAIPPASQLESIFTSHPSKNASSCLPGRLLGCLVKKGSPSNLLKPVSRLSAKRLCGGAGWRGLWILCWWRICHREISATLSDQGHRLCPQPSCGGGTGPGDQCAPCTTGRRLSPERPERGRSTPCCETGLRQRRTGKAIASR